MQVYNIFLFPPILLLFLFLFLYKYIFSWYLLLVI